MAKKRREPEELSQPVDGGDGGPVGGISRESAAREFEKIIEAADRPMDKIAALKALTELRGWRSVKDVDDLRGKSNAEIVKIVRAIIRPALAPMGIEVD